MWSDKAITIGGKSENGTEGNGSSAGNDSGGNSRFSTSGNYPSSTSNHDPSESNGGNGNYTSGSYSSYTPQQLHISNIVNTIKYSGGTLVGGIAGDYRIKRNEKLDVNYYLTEPIQRMHREKVVGNEYLKGMVFHDCYLNDGDMDYIINMPDWVDYNFKIIDFSNNSGITDLGIQYALRGNISHDDGIKYKGFLGRDRLHVIKLDLSNCNISDGGASLIAEALCDGKLASTKYINLSGNKITETGKGFIIKAIDKINHGISVTLETIQNISKETFKISVKAMLSIAKNNGISTKEALTTEETIEHCKKGVPNVGYNLSWGIIKCFTGASTPIALYEMDGHSLLVNTTVSIINPLKKPMQFVCMTQETFFSVVDEDFANCLTGVDSGLNE